MLQQIVFLFLATIVLCADWAAADGMDFGDGAALVLGVLISIIGILACLGAHARKLRANQF